MIGETLGAYTIVRKLGAGGMGEVYLADHKRIDRRAAIKLLLPQLSSEAALVERFFAEARATSSVKHPGIVEVLDCDVHPSGRAYIVMEYLEGESLGQALERTGAMPVPLLAFVGAQTASALAAVHGRGNHPPRSQARQPVPVRGGSRPAPGRGEDPRLRDREVDRR